MAFKSEKQGVKIVNAIDVKDLNFFYEKNQILKNINFSVKQGSICGLLGPNGSGKSTFFRCVLNFLAPQSGRIWINGTSSTKLKHAKMANQIAYVPQNSEIAFAFSVLEVVLMGRSPKLKSIFGLSNNDYAISRAMLEKVGMLEFENKNFQTLSGGQKQLVLLARALAQETPIIILDEPTSALDFKNQILVWKILKEISKSGVTLLVCTHEPNHILWFCDEVVAFYEGSVVANDKVEIAITREFLHQIYGDKFNISNLEKQKIIFPEI